MPNSLVFFFKTMFYVSFGNHRQLACVHNSRAEPHPHAASVVGISHARPQPLAVCIPLHAGPAGDAPIYTNFIYFMQLNLINLVLYCLGKKPLVWTTSCLRVTTFRQKLVRFICCYIIANLALAQNGISVYRRNFRRCPVGSIS